MPIDIDAHDIDTAFREFQGIGHILIEEITLDVWGIATEEANIRKGALRSSIQYEVGDHEGIVGTNLEYAPYVHEGFPAHDIVAVHAQALGPFALGTYLGKKIGGFVGKQSMKRNKLSMNDVQFFKKVHHPGYAGNPFFITAIERAEGKQDEYEELVKSRLGWE